MAYSICCHLKSVFSYLIRSFFVGICNFIIILTFWWCLFLIKFCPACLAFCKLWIFYTPGYYWDDREGSWWINGACNNWTLSWKDYLLLILSERVLGRSTSKRVVTGKDKRKIPSGRTEQIVEHKWRITSSTSRNYLIHVPK